MDAILTMLRVVVSLAAVLGVIWYLQRRVSRRQLRTKKKTNPVTVVGKQGIAAKASVVVVDVDGRPAGARRHRAFRERPPFGRTGAGRGGELRGRPRGSRRGCGSGCDADALAPVSAETHAPAPAASPVAGSILAASTWKLALTSVRNGLK